MLSLEMIAVLGVLFALLVNAMVRTQLAKRLLMDAEQKTERVIAGAAEKAR